MRGAGDGPCGPDGGCLHAPSTAAEVHSIVADALAEGRSLAVRGGGTKRALRWCEPASAVLDLCGLAGITDYDPDELVLTARAGTRLKEIEEALGARRQMLAFDPFDHSSLAGGPSGGATLGGIVAANVSGPRRLTAGAARDHLLGFSAVSGGGDAFKGGGAVVKNVTGFDLPKLMAGSWGTLAVLTSITVRVLPRPRSEKTVVFEGLSDQQAGALMNAAMALPAAVSCAAHLPASAAGAGVSPRTVLRLEGFEPSVAARCRELRRALSPRAASSVLEACPSAALWEEVRSVALLPRQGRMLWRVSVPPANGWRVRAALQSSAAAFLYDWGGALVWVAFADQEAQTGSAALPGVARALGGHAWLVDAGSMPRHAPVIPDSGVQRLRSRVKAAFDPRGILNPGVDPAGEV